MLTHVGASRDGPNMRIFECSKCGNVHKSMDDPLRSTE